MIIARISKTYVQTELFAAGIKAGSCSNTAPVCGSVILPPFSFSFSRVAGLNVTLLLAQSTMQVLTFSPFSNSHMLFLLQVTNCARSAESNSLLDALEKIFKPLAMLT